jgi:zinc transport system permease protein
LYGAVAAALIAAVVIGAFETKRIYRNDLLIGIIWALGMAVGIAFIYITPGFAPDLMTFLFGNILTVSRLSVCIFFLLVLTVVLFVVIFFKGFVLITLDEEYARARKLPVNSLKIGLMLLVALSIVTLIQIVGIVLVIALLTMPVAAGSELSSNFKKIMALSILIGILACMGGLALSYLVEFPSGASIVLIGGVLLGAIKGTKGLLSIRRGPA